MKNSQHGSHITMVIIMVAVIVIIGALLFVFISNSRDKDRDTTLQNEQTNSDVGPIWQQREDGWQSVQTPPKCPSQPMLSAPADLSKATSVLYPGETRGQYKPHGGLRFDNSIDNKITVKAPFDGYIVKATRNFAEGTTEIQYGFDIMNNCGIMTRFGHLRDIPEKLRAIVSKLPEASTNSKIENVNPAVFIKQGEVLATKVGLTSEKNTFFDWGVYDYRQQNEASKSADYRAAHPQKELAWHAVCWLRDWLPAGDIATLTRLPGGAGENTNASDYCK